MERIITETTIQKFLAHLRSEEKGKNTVEKYLLDVRTLAAVQNGGAVTKEAVIAYKQHLIENGYAVRSVNSMLASLNSLFLFLGWHDLKVETVKVQREIFCSEEKELTKAEYERLCQAALSKQNERLNLILQTICGTGIRVSELPFITVEAVRRGEAIVNCKGKPTNRSTVWRKMKGLFEWAGVNPQKVFPHNLRHLFARVFYGIEKDIAKLAVILGHSSINTTRIYIVSTGTEH